jgi:deoxynucleoside triphosphate triphosphohydrolase SAMHD1
MSDQDRTSTAKAIEYMIIDAILAAEPHMKIAEQIADPKRYMWLTDDIKLRIQADPAPVR